MRATAASRRRLPRARHAGRQVILVNLDPGDDHLVLVRRQSARQNAACDW